MSRPMTWKDHADDHIGRCPVCDEYTWRGRCPGCDQRRFEAEQRRRERKYQ